MTQPDEVNALIASLSSQRNNAQNEAALAQARLAVAQAMIADLKAQLEKQKEEETKNAE